MERPTVVQAFGHLMHNVGLFIPPTIHNRHSDANIHQCHWGDALPHTHKHTSGRTRTVSYRRTYARIHTRLYTPHTLCTHTHTNTYKQVLTRTLSDTHSSTQAPLKTQAHTYTHTARVRESEKIESKKPERYLYEGGSDGRCGSGCSECHNTAA